MPLAKLQKINNDSSPVFWLNTILFKNTDKFAIRDLGSHLMKIGIEVRSGFWPLSDMEAFSSEVYGLQSNGHHLYDNLLVLPSAMSLTERDIEYIYQEICKFLKK